MPFNSAFTIRALIMSALVLGFAPVNALAQDTLATETPPLAPTNDILPVKSAEEADIVIDETNPTHPAVKLTPDKSELIRLEKSASAVIVGNPAHVSILPEGSNILVLVPKAPGATYFTALDENNQVIMQRHVIVAAPKEKYVRIRKSCAGADDCQNTQVYYCPDMCHEIILNAAGETKNSGSKTVGQEVDEAIEAIDKHNEEEDEKTETAPAEQGTTEE